MSCWAAAIAMIVCWARSEKISPRDIAKRSDRLDEYQTGLSPLDEELFDRWNMVSEAPQTYTAEGFMDLLQEYGPVWAAAKVTAPHVRVITGFEFAEVPYQGPVFINDPLERSLKSFRASNRGQSYSETYVQFVNESEKLGSEELTNPVLNDDKLYPVYFAHLKVRP